MKRSLLAIVLALATLIAGSAIASAGNGAPQGPHEYQLNIIGVDNPKNVDMDGGNGRRIFVDLHGKSKINLTMSTTDEFAVLDANGTGGSAALFEMPPPGYNAFDVNDPCGDEVIVACDTTSNYSVFIRPLGKPGGYAIMTTCADIVESTLSTYFSKKYVKYLNEAAELGGVCSIEQVGALLAEEDDRLWRTTGKSSFENVTAELTSIVLEVLVDADGDLTDPSDQEVITIRVPIFDDALENEYWEYDNNGLRLAQVRFYMCETDVATGLSDC